METLRQHLVALPEASGRPRLHADEFKGALAVLFWVCTAAPPVALPLAVFHDLPCAMLVSRIVAIALLFFGGYGYGLSTGLRPWITGVIMVLIGAVLVGTTVALGG